MTQVNHNLSPDYDVEEMKPVEVDDTETALTLLGKTTFYSNTSCAGTTNMQAVTYPSDQAKEEFKQVILGVQDE
jgi:hypothetical protein